MQHAQYRTQADHTIKSWPPGVPYIIGNEGCERFSYYGMNAILYTYCVSLFAIDGITNNQAADMATSTIHLFKTGVYAFPMIGAIIADRLLGKYLTIFWLSLVYCLGHVVLSATEGSINGLYAGLFLIAIGSGGIKPCVSAHVGDQFGKNNWHLLEKVYQIFYFIINFGSFFAVLFIPLLKEWFGWRIAFLVPGILMFIATFIFFLGRNHFVHAQANPGGKLGFYDAISSILLFLVMGSWFFTASYPVYIMAIVSLSFLCAGLMVFFYRQKLAKDDGFLAICLWMTKEYFANLFTKKSLVLACQTSGSGPQIPSSINSEFSQEATDGVEAVLKIIGIFFMVSIFWALFDQHSSSWIRQAEMMKLNVTMPFFGEIKLLASQIPSLNPIMVMALIPLWSYFIEPFINKFVKMTHLKKMSMGMFLASISFIAVAILQQYIDDNPANSVSVLWQIIPYLLITMSEVLVSVTGLEFAYSQAPKRMKSSIMGFWLLSVALGNVLVALLAHFSGLQLADFFWLFALLMAVAGVLFSLRAKNYVVKDYTS